MKKLLLLFAFLCLDLTAQVYSPKLLRAGQPDATDLKKFATAIYADAGAHTDREKAEAIWRFFLTDGRFVKPGFWYHIAGWTYEEPSGEVLDPMKLINSYGFGLCYHIAPLLAAVFEAGGFESARCWFLTGHTVAEVFYDGGYHYFDSDMMGYNVAGTGPFKGKPVVSVRALEQNSSIILGKLVTPRQVRLAVVDNPWYPADVRAGAMGDLAELFTTSNDNYLYPFKRYASSHSMDFVLRRGEKLIRFFQPEEPGLFYLPYKFDGKTWTEFPQEIAEYQIRTADGPRSQKDSRLWATGRIEYAPPALPQQATTVIDMPSPYVIIDARFTMNATLTAKDSSLEVETSTDAGHTWQPAGHLSGLHEGQWSVEPQVIVASAHGRKTAVSGSYGYQVRISNSNPATVRVDKLQLVSRIQVNPRTLPEVRSGRNEFNFSTAAPVERHEIPVKSINAVTHGIECVEENGQSFFRPAAGQNGESVYELKLDGRTLTGFEAGARFFAINKGLVPDKLTAETRHTQTPDANGAASLSWATSPEGSYQEIWNFPGKLAWRDGDAIDRLLQWPEVLKTVDALAPGTRRVYVKFKSSGPAFDSLRFALKTSGPAALGQMTITQIWQEGGAIKQHVERANGSLEAHRFWVTAGTGVRNQELILSNQ